jgi:hypothetical protein
MSWTLYINTKDSDGAPTYLTPVDGMTYNLTPMWSKAIPFLDVTRDFDGKKCSDILEDLKIGLNDILDNSDEYRKLEPDNGWGDFDGFFTVYIHLIRDVAQNPDGICEWSG